METTNFLFFNHRGMECIGVKLALNDSRIGFLKKIPGIKWTQTHRCWYGEKSTALENLLKEIFGQSSMLLPATKSEPEATLPVSVQGMSVEESLKNLATHLEIRRYSVNTITNCMSAIGVFTKFFSDRDWRLLDKLDMIHFQKTAIIDRNLSISYQNVMINAIKLFYEVNTGTKMDPGFIQRPRPIHDLPIVFSVEDVKRLLLSIKNPKHKMMISLIYACGLRAGDLVNLKIQDIDKNRMVITFRKGKGNKDRMVPVSENFLNKLRDYYKLYRPLTWLFEGQIAGEPYSMRSLQLVFQQSLKAAGITQKHTLHHLRHSYATHQMDAGTNLRFIQEVLGHKNSKTTEQYTHVTIINLSKIHNPFDDLGI
jgi:integrase/recombinase XerD